MPYGSPRSPADALSRYDRPRPASVERPQTTSSASQFLGTPDSPSITASRPSEAMAVLQLDQPPPRFGTADERLLRGRDGHGRRGHRPRLRPSLTAL